MLFAEKLREIMTEKRIGVRKVAEERRSMGYRNREGKPFSPVHIRRILKNEMYAGIKQSFRHYDKMIAQGKKKKTKRPQEDWISIPVPAIVDRETWERAQKATSDNAIVSLRKVKHEYLVRNVVKCGYCGYAMIGYSGNSYQYYSCIHKPSYASIDKFDCPSKYIRQSVLDEYVWDALRAWADGQAELSALVQSGGPDYSAQIKTMTDRYNELIEQQSEIMKWYHQKRIDPRVAEQELDAVSKDIAAAQSSISSLKRTQAEIKKQVSVTPAQILNAVTFDDRRSVILQLQRDGFQIIAKKEKADIIWYFA